MAAKGHESGTAFDNPPAVQTLSIEDPPVLPHLHPVALEKTLQVSGVDVSRLQGSLDFCDPCWSGKFHTTILKTDRLLKMVPTKPFEIFHMDFLVSPCEAIGGYKYGLVMIDLQPRFVFVELTKSRKSQDVVSKLNALFVLQGAFPQMLVIDRDSPFVSQELFDWCVANHVQFKKIPQARHEFHGLAENVIKVLQSRLTTMLLDAQLPKTYWGFALLYAAYVRNRSAHVAQDWKSPFHMRFDKLPSNEFLRWLSPLCSHLRKTRLQSRSSRNRTQRGMRSCSAC